jgi:ribonuclease BN (tRNA processing enzyme)
MALQLRTGHMMNISIISRRAVCIGLALFSSLAAAQPVPPPADDTVQVITLGTAGGPRVRLKRSAPANALIVGNAVYVIDAGDRTLQQLAAARVNLERVKAVFITHHHLDHTAGLSPMLGIRWMTNVTSPLKFVGPPGMKAIAQGLQTSIQPALAIGTAGKILDPLHNVDVQEVTGSGVVYQDENIKVTAAENTHFHMPVTDPAKKPLSFAYRIETKQGVVVFTGDTGPSDAVTELARGADMLVSEVVNPDATLAEVRRNAPRLSAQAFANIRAHLVEDHVAPDAVGQMAAKAGVKQVVLSHLGPGLDSESAEDADALYAAGVRKFFNGPVKVASDLQVFTLRK